MSILSNQLDFKFSENHREIHPFRLYDNYIIAFTENFQYTVLAATTAGNTVQNSKPFAEGKLPEDPENAYFILNPESFFFDVISPHEFIYYSPTGKNLKQFNFKTGEVVGEIPCTLELKEENTSFFAIKYNSEKNSARILHIKDENNVSLKEIAADGVITEVKDFALKNPNCITQSHGRIFFASQILYKEPLKICFFDNNSTGEITFDFKEKDITPLDISFFDEKTLLVVYNSNGDTSNGIYSLNLNDYSFDGEFKIDVDDSDNCTHIELALPENELECYDGRMILDKIVKTITLFGYVSHIIT